MTRAPAGWLEANQRRLTAELARVRGLVAQQLGRGEGQPVLARDQIAAATPVPGRSALDALCAAFGLTPFERDLLLLCAGVEMSSDLAALVAAARGENGRPGATFALALALLPEPHWSALAPGGPLRRWRLVEVDAADGLTQGALRIDERALHHLAGLLGLDERLQELAVPVPLPDEPLPPSLQALADRVAGLWNGRSEPLPVVLSGEDPSTRRLVLATACRRLELPLHLLRAADLPAAPADRQLLARLWAREVALGGVGALLVECDDDGEQPRAAAHFCAHAAGRLAASARDPVRLAAATAALEVRLPAVAEQRALWQRALGARARDANGAVDRIISQFQLGPLAIRAVGQAVAEALGESPARAVEAVVWDACRAHARVRLDDLAQRIVATATWDDLVLPAAQLATLREIVTHVRQRTKVYETWGFARRGGRGLGIGALFAGLSGTGKTMAAEVIADALRLDLYRIDLSQVVSKYIGETEKNLRRIFDAAEASGAVLLFDEADALFGKRAEVKDSHDRYANIEVSYLLQRMESYRGLAILTTNNKASLDGAFVRRLRFVVSFPFPDAAQRAEIWRRVFPRDTPTDGLEPERLARLGVPGANIRNIALAAAFLAADAGEPVRMAHLLRAARSELAKMEKPVSEAEIGGWA
ncbi:MAG TPA: ATP-binding protein [Vicinamibacteria bacterium]|nr:ATP-binding protein [Vicinamibacteria bacterium]